LNSIRSIEISHYTE